MAARFSRVETRRPARGLVLGFAGRLPRNVRVGSALYELALRPVKGFGVRTPGARRRSRRGVRPVRLAHAQHVLTIHKRLLRLSSTHSSESNPIMFSEDRSFV